MPVEETTNEIRARVRQPSEFVANSFRFKSLSESKGIGAIIGKLKSSGSYEIQAYRFKKSKGWTIEKVKAWLKSHNITAKGITELKENHEPFYGEDLKEKNTDMFDNFLNDLMKDLDSYQKIHDNTK